MNVSGAFILMTVKCPCRVFLRHLHYNHYNLTVIRRLAIAKRPCECCVILKSGFYLQLQRKKVSIRRFLRMNLGNCTGT